MLLRWLRRILLAAAGLFIALYLGDWAVYRLRGAPTQAVSVNQFVDIPLKGSKTEYDYLGNSSLRCAVALFAQDGLDPCWKLRRNAKQLPAP
ncbi:MAG TPA: hypothetical protein VGR64_04960 [Terracidiphilus sp.]|nr:hypothetical protein [Terracidiphilus sp.]